MRNFFKSLIPLNAAKLLIFLRQAKYFAAFLVMYCYFHVSFLIFSRVVLSLCFDCHGIIIAKSPFLRGIIFAVKL